MLFSVEVVIDEKGTVRLLEPIELPTARRAILTILMDDSKSNIEKQGETSEVATTKELGILSTSGNQIEVHFMHPRNSALSLTADVSSECTGQEALQELMRDENGKGPFIPPLPEGQVYDLIVRRTQQLINPNMTFSQAGVVHGDIIYVGQAATGAGPGYSFNELAEILIQSGLTLAFIKAITQIIVQLLKNKESRSIRIKYDNDEEKKEIEIKGSNSIDDLIKAALIMERHKTNPQQLSSAQETNTNERSSQQDNPSEPQNKIENNKVDDDLPGRT